MPDDPTGVGKFKRACIHLEAIQSIVEAWSKETTYKTISEPDPDGSGLVHCERYVARIGGPPLPDISLLLGDCLHNFRGVLDHTIWFASCVNRGDPPPGPKRIAFPAWDDADTYKARGLHAVSTKVKAVVESLQPYHAGKDARSHPLWALSELNNVDKHREVHAVFQVALAPTIGVSSTNAGVWYEAMDAGPVEDGTVVARLFIPLSFQRTEVEVNLNTSHGVVIDKTETTPYLHLGNTLGAIRDAVHDAAKRITEAL